MRSNHDPAIVTLFHSTLEHTLDHFLEFWIFEGVRHFLAIFAQPPTTLLTLHGCRDFDITEIDITESDVTETDITENDITESDITDSDIT